MLQVVNRSYKDHLGRTIIGSMPIANQGDKGTYEVDYEVYFGTNLSFDLSISVSDNSNILTLNGLTWAELGVASGDVVNVVSALSNIDNTNQITGTFTVNITSGNEAITATTFGFSDVLVSGELYVDKAPEAIRTNINLIPNTQSSGIESLIDATSITLQENDISAMTIGSTLPLNIVGNKSGGGIIDYTITRIADTRSGRARNYTIEISFYWWLYLSNFENYSFDVDCVTPYIETSFFRIWNNPSVVLSDGFKPSGDGNSGFRDENFNQNPSNFEVTSVEWDDGINVIDGFDYSKQSFFKIDIETLVGNGFGSDVGLVFFNDISNSDKYSASQNNNKGDYSHLQHTTFAENANIPTTSTIINFDSFIGENGEKVTVNVEASVSGSTLTLEGDIMPNQPFIDKFSDTTNLDNIFCLLARAESSTFSASNYSDTVNLLSWMGEAKKYPPILGEYFDVTTLNDHANNLIHTYL